MLDQQQQPQVSRAVLNVLPMVHESPQPRAHQTMDPSLTVSATEKVTEPDKCEEWVWLTLSQVSQKSPGELFLPIQNLMKQVPDLEKILDTGA